VPDVLALDPGERTGFALLRDNVLVRTGVLPIWEGERPDYRLLAELFALLGKKKVVVVERFLSGGHLTQTARHTLETLGAIEYLATVPLPPHTLVWHMPSARIALLNEHAIPILTPHLAPYRKEQHPYDAFAHALAYLVDVLPPGTPITVSPQLCVVGLRRKHA
jgi:hypothetical protein